MPPLRTALLSQIFGGLIALSAIQIVYPALFASPAVIAVLQGGFAAMVSHKLGAPRWWIPIQLGFLPLAVVASRLGIPPLAWFGGFMLLLLLFWRTDKNQVPLFMTNAKAAEAVNELLPRIPLSFLDMGCGTGFLLRHLAASRPECRFAGIEHAPLPFLLAWTRSLGRPNMTVKYGDFWHADLGQYEAVYAFLSPVPMKKLWEKCRAEMTPDAFLISNSFEIPNIPASLTVDVPDRRRTRLFCYRPGVGKQGEDSSSNPPIVGQQARQ